MYKQIIYRKIKPKHHYTS